MITLDKIRTRLIEAIKQSGKSQTELARILSVKQQTIACYISGRAMPALDTFAKLCAVLDLDANEILCVNEFDTP
ncbi:MAG: helix-turn-helix domain-containing protein [Clostridia bacterium]|nr:helix-turn-helix domain-containing protein [Clostridia bacterium]